MLMKQNVNNDVTKDSPIIMYIQLFEKRLSWSIVDTGTERHCGFQAAQIIYYYQPC